MKMLDDDKNVPMTIAQSLSHLSNLAINKFCIKFCSTTLFLVILLEEQD